MVDQNPYGLTPEQLEEVKEVYDFIDKNGDGIAIEELEAAMKSWGLQPTQEELEEMMAKADKDGSGAIDFIEFCGLMKERMELEEKNNELFIAFSAFDRDGNGFVSRKELSYIMMNVGQKLNQEEFDYMMSIVDKDGDG